jgi:hypothetical protein
MGINVGHVSNVTILISHVSRCKRDLQNAC